MSLNPADLLSNFSTCEVSDALIKLGEPNGGHLPDIYRISPSPDGPCPRLCGPAYTVFMDFVSEQKVPNFQGHFVDLAPEGSVVFILVPPGQSAPPPMLSPLTNTPQNKTAENAVWGGLMTAGAQARGVVGAIVWGRVRDTAEHRAAGFPVFARGTSTVGQASFTRAVEVQIPLVVTNIPRLPGALPMVCVNPGDLLLADEDGVVCIPKQLEQEVLRMAELGREVDARCLKDIQAGVGVEESFRRHRSK